MNEEIKDEFGIDWIVWGRETGIPEKGNSLFQGFARRWKAMVLSNKVA